LLHSLFSRGTYLKQGGQLAEAGNFAVATQIFAGRQACWTLLSVQKNIQELKKPISQNVFCPV